MIAVRILRSHVFLLTRLFTTFRAGLPCNFTQFVPVSGPLTGVVSGVGSVALSSLPPNQQASAESFGPQFTAAGYAFRNLTSISPGVAFPRIVRFHPQGPLAFV